MAEGHDNNPLSHVVDHPSLEIPFVGDVPLPWPISRFMVMEVIAAVLVVLVIVPLARHIAANRVTRGRFRNIFEILVLFIRDTIARPAIDGAGHDHHDEAHDADQADEHGAHAHHAHHGDEGGLLGYGPGSSPPLKPIHGRLSDRFMPFLWTLFFFILFCNLLGMIPGGASATGNINVTAVLATLTLVAVVTAGMMSMGFAGFWLGIVPKMEVPGILKPILWGMMFVIEVLGLFIRHIVLSVRLFANMMAGHIVLAVILGFIVQATGWLTYLVTPASILGSVAISMLELFVAFLQAYIFTFLAALFIGSAAHPH